MWLRACLNGPRLAGSHPALPITPSELARDGRRAVDAGAVALHIHPRAANGTETLEPEPIAAALIALRTSCPGIPLEVSTAAWIEQDVARRLAFVRSWIELPDSAGVNFGEAGAMELATTLLARGVGVEAGIFTAEDAHRLIATGLAQQCNHVQIEPILTQNISEAISTARAIERVLDEAGVSTPRLLHGKDRTAWALLAYAATQGYATRIGLEDTLLLPSGARAQDNADLIQTALAFDTRPAC